MSETISSEGPYSLGESVVLFGFWADDDGTPVAPVNPKLTVTRPSGAVDVYLEADLDAPATGRREREIVVNETGRWTPFMEATGPKPKSQSWSFHVKRVA